MDSPPALAAVGGLVVATVGLAAVAAPPVVIYSEIPGAPSSLVPAGAGVPAGTRFDSFDRPYRSPDGLSWILSASTDLATALDEVIILGSGVAGATVVREGTTFGVPAGVGNVGIIDRNLGLLDDGRYAYTTNTDGDTASDELVVVWDGAAHVIAAREGDPIPAIPGETYGSSLDSAGLLDDGSAVFRATGTVGGLPDDEDDLIFAGGSILGQSGATVPGGQAGGAELAWENFDLQDVYLTADGGAGIAQGDLEGTVNDDIVVSGGLVVVQEGSVLAGGPFTSPVETPLEIALGPAGDWFARGDNEDQQDWVVRNGTVIAARGEPVVPGSTERYSDDIFTAAFFWMQGNAAGDWVVGGTTSNPDDLADAVLVLNGTTILARQGDPVDVDGNGLADDDAFIDIFNNDDGFLTEDGRLYFTAELADGFGITLGQAFLVLDVNAVPPTCTGDVEPVGGDGAVGFDDLLVLLTAYGACPDPCATGCAGDLDRDCDVDFDDVLVLLTAYGPCP